MARGILQGDSANLLLYDAYARIQLLRGNARKARFTYAECLKSLSSHADARVIWLSWAEMAWIEGESAVATSILATSVGAVPDSQLGATFVVFGCLELERLTFYRRYAGRSGFRLTSTHFN